MRLLAKLKKQSNFSNLQQRTMGDFVAEALSPVVRSTNGALLRDSAYPAPFITLNLIPASRCLGVFPIAEAGEALCSAACATEHLQAPPQRPPRPMYCDIQRGDFDLKVTAHRGLRFAIQVDPPDQLRITRPQSRQQPKEARTHRFLPVFRRRSKVFPAARLSLQRRSVRRWLEDF